MGFAFLLLEKSPLKRQHQRKATGLGTGSGHSASSSASHWAHPAMVLEAPRLAAFFFFNVASGLHGQQACTGCDTCAGKTLLRVAWGWGEDAAPSLLLDFLQALNE